MSETSLVARPAAAEHVAAVPKRRRRRLPDLSRWISPLAIVVLWQLASSTGVLPEDKLSSPWTVLQSGIELAQTGELGEAFVVSLRRVAIGFALGAAIGLSTKDVKLNFLQPADAYAAFTQKQVDAWAIWDPYTSQAKLEAGAKVLTDGTGIANGYTFQVASRGALADAGKNAAIKDYVTRIAKAQKWSDSHRPEWAKAWATETGLALTVTNAATAQGPDLPVALDDQVIASEQQLADAFTDDKVLPGKVDFAAFVDKRYAADLDAARSSQ